MLGLIKTGAVRSPDADGSARSRDIYQHYAVALYRQALLARHDSAWAENVVCDVIVNERALALVPEPGEHDARYRLAELIFRRCRQLVASPVQQARRYRQRRRGPPASDLGHSSPLVGIKERRVAARSSRASRCR